MIHSLFWTSIAFTIYVYLIYPVSVVIISKFYKKTPILTSLENLPSITMIIIVFNEENNIHNKIKNCRELNYPIELFDLCVVSDGSTDLTNKILELQQDIIFIKDSTNKGKPYQINKAVEMTENEILVFSDARQLFKPDALVKLTRNFSVPSIGAVSGELNFLSTKDKTRKNIGLYWKYEKILRKAESAIDSTLGVTGAIYAIRRKCFNPIPVDTILDDIEIPLQAFRNGYRIIFDSDAIAYDTITGKIETEFKRKVRTLTGNFQLFSRNLWLLNPFKNRIFLQSISHKLFRLFVPYALFLIFITSCLYENMLIQIFFYIQIVCYAMSISSLFIKRLLKFRLINLFSVFLTLNAASVVALYKFLFEEIEATWKK